MNDRQIEPDVKRTPKTEAERILSELERHYFPEMYKDVLGKPGGPLRAQRKKRVLSLLSDFYDNRPIPPAFSLVHALLPTDASSKIPSGQMFFANEEPLVGSSFMQTLAVTVERAWVDAGREIANTTKTELHRTLSDAIDLCLDAWAAEDAGNLDRAWPAVVDTQATLSRVETESSNKRWRSRNAQAGAEALHNQPGGTRNKRQEIREIWATGKYSSRDICAEQECAALSMSFSTARKALRNTADPKRT